MYSIETINAMNKTPEAFAPATYSTLTVSRSSGHIVDMSEGSPFADFSRFVRSQDTKAEVKKAA